MTHAVPFEHDRRGTDRESRRDRRCWAGRKAGDLSGRCAATSGAPSAQAPADPQFEAAKNFISFYTFNRLAYKQVCDKQAVDVSAFVNTFVSENAGAYAKAMSVLQAHGISEAKVMAKLQPTIASSE